MTPFKVLIRVQSSWAKKQKKWIATQHFFQLLQTIPLDENEDDDNCFSDVHRKRLKFDEAFIRDYSWNS